MEYLAVEFLILFLLALARRMQKQRICFVDGLGLLRLLRLLIVLLLGGLLFCLFGLLLHLHFVFEVNRDGHERAVFLQYALDAVLVREFIAVLVQIKRDHRAALRVIGIVHGKFHALFRFPVNGLCARLIGKRVDGHLMGYHEGAVKAETEMTDDLVFVGLVFVFFKEIRSSGKRYLVDVLFHFFGGHADTVIDKCEGLLLGIRANGNAPFVVLGKLRLADQRKLFQLRHGITAV